MGSVPRVVGVDLDLPALRNHRTIRHRVGASITRLPFPDRSFDLVTAAMVVEHLDEPIGSFREVCRVLRPGGRFVFHTPNVRGYQIRLGRALPQPVKNVLVRVVEGRPADDVFPAHYRANEPGAIERISRAAGLRVEEVRLVLTHAEFATFLPLAVVELLWLRMLAGDGLSRQRPNIIGILSRPRG